jgi:hypothetical protein
MRRHIRVALPVILVIFTAVTIATALCYAYVIVSKTTPPAVLAGIVAGGAGRNDLLFSNSERLLLLPEEDESNKDMSWNETMRLSDWRYTNLIRSLMSRPDPSKPQRFSFNDTKNRHFSEVN